MNELKWGTQDPFIVVDPEEGVNIHVRAYGLFGVHIEQTDTAKAVSDARKFLMKVVGTRDIFTREELTDFMRAKLIEYSKTELAKTIDDQKISILTITSQMSQQSELMQANLTKN